MKQVIDKIPNGKCLVAVSGGADSMALLHMLKDVPGIEVAHVNHRIRPDSMEDQKLVTEFCEQHKIPLQIRMLLNPPKTGIEEWARNQRYEFFTFLMELLDIPYLLTAHNANDQAETVIMKMMRGTGVKGLRGIHRNTGSIVRPLLDMTKDEIYAYCAANSVPFREDYTNKDTKYFRNKVRHEILDKKHIPQLCRIADLAQSAYPKILSAAKKEMRQFITRTEDRIVIDRKLVLDDLAFIFIADLVSDWFSMSELGYELMKSTAPETKLFIFRGTKITCDKRSPKNIKLIRKT